MNCWVESVAILILGIMAIVVIPGALAWYFAEQITNGVDYVFDFVERHSTIFGVIVFTTLGAILLSFIFCIIMAIHQSICPLTIAH